MQCIDQVTKRALGKIICEANVGLNEVEINGGENYTISDRFLSCKELMMIMIGLLKFCFKITKLVHTFTYLNVSIM